MKPKRRGRAIAERAVACAGALVAIAGAYHARPSAGDRLVAWACRETPLARFGVHDGLRGLVATRNITAGEIVADVPTARMLTPASALRTLNVLDDETWAGNAEDALVLLLATARVIGYDRFPEWEVYFCALPRVCGLAEDERRVVGAVLRDATTTLGTMWEILHAEESAKIEHMLAPVAACARRRCGVCAPKDNATYENALRWAIRIKKSRAWGEGLAPFVDIANHADLWNANAAVLFTTVSAELRAVREIRAGDPVYISYHAPYQHCDINVLWAMGFVDEHPNDCAILPTARNASDAAVGEWIRNGTHAWLDGLRANASADVVVRAPSPATVCAMIADDFIPVASDVRAVSPARLPPRLAAIVERIAHGERRAIAHARNFAAALCEREYG